MESIIRNIKYPRSISMATTWLKKTTKLIRQYKQPVLLVTIRCGDRFHSFGLWWLRRVVFVDREACKLVLADKESVVNVTNISRLSTIHTYYSVDVSIAIRYAKWDNSTMHNMRLNCKVLKALSFTFPAMKGWRQTTLVISFVALK